ncbi:hypothetical protein CERZMDRAFT_87503 [Cercospora zeae-maydis SCOH1-5]|uniref:Uncharacterized protein n=1 Tax=Cercospora zeae-maydis SCOH1-5 TaxID=717836 RepID=A0A6A6F5V4_9PEZI|nr:hypothetical protein CERZMDRAFT_87503 [Cercospora zeae-maydis SCOH1-5]
MTIRQPMHCHWPPVPTFSRLTYFQVPSRRARRLRARGTSHEIGNGSAAGPDARQSLIRRIGGTICILTHARHMCNLQCKQISLPLVNRKLLFWAPSMGVLVRIQKKFENKWLHKNGDHGKPVYYADPDEDIENNGTTRRSTSGTGSSSRPGSRLANLSFLSSRRNSSQRQPPDRAPSRSSSFFCRGSSQQPHARRSLAGHQSNHARHGSALSTSDYRRQSGSGFGNRPPPDDAATDAFDTAFRIPAFSDSGYVSRDSDPGIGFFLQDHETLQSPSQMGNSMTLAKLHEQEVRQQSQDIQRDRQRPMSDGPPVLGLSSTVARGMAPERSSSQELRGRASSFTLGGHGHGANVRAGGAVEPVLSPGTMAEQYEAPSALSHEQASDQISDPRTAGLRGFEGDREGYFSHEREGSPRPKQPERAQTAAPPSSSTSNSARSAAATGRTSCARLTAEEARRARKPFTTTRALTGF